MLARNKKECMQAALECRQPETFVPIWELHFHCWNQASGEHFVIGREFEGLSPSEQERALAVDAEIMIKVAEQLHFAAVTIPDGYWEMAPGVPSYYWLPEQARYLLAQRINQISGSDFMVIAAAGGVMGMPDPENYVEFSYKLFDAPEEIDEMARNKLAKGVERVRKMRDAGVEAVYAAADLADNHGPYYSPRQMNRYVLPYLKKWAAYVKEMGLYAILHTDGNINPILNSLVDSGIHALQAIDPIAGMDIRKVKSLVGQKICLVGNIDCGLLFNGPEEAIFTETRDLLLDCKPDGCFVLGASNAIQRETPIEHYLSLVRSWEIFGSYEK
jgi:uroporphyrinogen decarboxylase